MEKPEYLQHWTYFCALAQRLEETKNYIYHGLQIAEDGSEYLIHGEVYSDNLKQIIILAASEFETIAKVLCAERGKSVKNIKEISETILAEFPRIVETEVISVFWTSTPLKSWRIDESGKLLGLDWWRAYNALKHDDAGSFRKATLENAISSLSALFILDMYLMYELSHSLSIAYEYPPVYFRSKYTAGAVLSGEGLLPDYGNKTPYEIMREKYPTVFQK